MPHPAAELTTDLADLNDLPLRELSHSHDPVLLDSVELVAARVERTPGTTLQDQ